MAPTWGSASDTGNPVGTFGMQNLEQLSCMQKRAAFGATVTTEFKRKAFLSASAVLTVSDWCPVECDSEHLSFAPLWPSKPLTGQGHISVGSV